MKCFEIIVVLKKLLLLYTTIKQKTKVNYVCNIHITGKYKCKELTLITYISLYSWPHYTPCISEVSLCPPPQT